MESCYAGMSTRLKQSAVTEFLSAENVTPAEIRIKLVLSMKAKDNGPVSVKAVAWYTKLLLMYVYINSTGIFSLQVMIQWH